MRFELGARWALVTALICWCVPRAEAQDASAASALDSLLSIRVSTASRYAQVARDAPGSVTIITADQIREHGYRTLHEVLESVPGFYISNDRNYPTLGVRGFSRPSDYNNRILLLIDGIVMNDDVWGGAPVGSDFPINLAAVERIEIVRGPGSVMYGTSAMFGVINIVSRSGSAVHGAQVAGRVGSAGDRMGSISAGRQLGVDGSVAISAQVNRSEGRSLYYSEFDDPEMGGGWAEGMDWEEGYSVLSSLELGGAVLRAGIRSRAKGIPTGSFGSTFGDPRAETLDETMWGELSVNRRIGNVVQLTGRVNANLYRYHGVYPFGDGAAHADAGRSATTGVDGMAVWDPISRTRLTFGAELRRAIRARYTEYLLEGEIAEDDAPFRTGAVFVQNELYLAPSATLVSGLRVDHHSRAGEAMSPRLALLLRPDAVTTVKLLYGGAFRAPTASEAYLETSFYQRNTALRAEHMRTVEVEVTRRLGAPVLLGLSTYDFSMRNLIDAVALDDDGMRFDNVAAASGRGVELRFLLDDGGPVALDGHWGIQRTTDRSTSEILTNSPRNVAALSVTGRGPAGFGSVVTLRHESSRRTLAATSTPSFIRTDLTVRYVPVSPSLPDWTRSTELVLRVTNLFDVAYFSPGGVEHRQPAIRQNGRELALSLTQRF